MDKEKILQKWAPILESMEQTNSHWGNISQLDQNQVDHVLGNTPAETNDITLLPIAKQMIAKTIGLDLVQVQPIGGGNSSTELEKIRNEIKVENRDRKVESIIDDKEFEEMKVEDHPDYKKPKGPSGELFYIDFQYGTTNSKV